MKRRLRLCAAVAAIGTANTFPAWSQEVETVDVSLNTLVEQWAADNGVIVTASGSQAALKAVAALFKSSAEVAGVDREKVAMFAAGIEQGGSIANQETDLIAKWGAREAALALSGPSQYEAVSKTLHPKLVFLQLLQLPTITIVVEPVPPVDFIIQINGETPSVAAPDGTYAVEPGEIVLLVRRNNKPDCTWKGKLNAGQKHSVTCKM